jgi:restriction system protein
MRFKMAEKSLFAILLRSPWWISFTLVAAFALASKALLPEPYVAYGVMGGFPFFVIGCISAWRQLQAPNPQHIEEALQKAARMSWFDFSAAVEKAFGKAGYQVARLNLPGADFKLEKAGRVTLLAAKRWKAVNQGVEPLRELVALRDAQKADLCSFISLGTLSDSALRFARSNQVELVAQATLAQWVGSNK